MIPRGERVHRVREEGEIDCDLWRSSGSGSGGVHDMQVDAT